MKVTTLLMIMLLAAQGTWAHGQPAAVDDKMPDAQKNPLLRAGS